MSSDKPSDTILSTQPQLQRAIIRLLMSKDDANLTLAVKLLGGGEAPPLVRAALLVAAHQARRSDSQQLFIKHALRRCLPESVIEMYDKLFYLHRVDDPYPGPNGLHVNSLTRLLSLDTALDGMEVARLMWQTDDVRLQACGLHYWLVAEDERQLFYILDNLKAGDFLVEKQHKLIRFYARLNEAIEQFRRREKLIFEGHQYPLSHFPRIVSDFIGLEEISLRHHHFTDFPQQISISPKLRKLDLTHNRFVSFPLFPSSMNTLLWLDMSFQQEAWQDYSGDLSGLQGLKSLWLMGNGLREIPRCIADLPNLVHVDVRDNAIQDIPDFLYEMPRLQSVDVRDNPLKKHKHVRGSKIVFRAD